MSNEYDSRKVECCNCKRTQLIGAYTINGKIFREARHLGDWLLHNDLFFCGLACVIQWAEK